MWPKNTTTGTLQVTTPFALASLHQNLCVGQDREFLWWRGGISKSTTCHMRWSMLPGGAQDNWVGRGGGGQREGIVSSQVLPVPPPPLPTQLIVLGSTWEHAPTHMAHGGFGSSTSPPKKPTILATTNTQLLGCGVCFFAPLLYIFLFPKLCVVLSTCATQAANHEFSSSYCQICSEKETRRHILSVVKVTLFVFWGKPTSFNGPFSWRTTAGLLRD